MRIHVAATITMLAVLAGCSQGAGPTETTPTGLGQRVADVTSAPGFIPGQYIVVFDRSVNDPPGLARALAAANGATIRFTYSSAIKGFSANMSDAAAAALAHNPNVAFVEQDQEAYAIGSETMDANGDPWGLDRIDARSGLDRSYTWAADGSGVTAYIIDTGILTTHSEFGGRATGEFTSISDGNGTNDCDGHGTHVAGTVGGATYGVAKNITLVAVRVLNCSGSGTWSGVIAGIDWVTAHANRPAVANMSLGGGASSAVDQAVQNSIASGVAYAIAAGNGNSGGKAQDACNYSPARVPEAMTIGATDKTDRKASWSNYGNCVDWFAPGVGIKSAWGTSNTATNTISGTSMATPHTTGVAAVYLTDHRSASPAEVRTALFNATTKAIVTSSNTANNDLLYSPPEGFSGGTTVNQPPVADFTPACTYLSCSFTNASNDPDGAIASFAWTFGDGGTSTASSPTHAYAAAGSYSVTLVVTDNNGAKDTATVDLTVNAPGGPTLSVTGSKIKSKYTATLTWSDFSTTVSEVDIYRNGSWLIAVLASPSKYEDSGKGGGSLTYQVCEKNSSTNCTNVVTISP